MLGKRQFLFGLLLALFMFFSLRSITTAISAVGSGLLVDSILDSPAALTFPRTSQALIAEEVMLIKVL